MNASTFTIAAKLTGLVLTLGGLLASLVLLFSGGMAPAHITGIVCIAGLIIVMAPEMIMGDKVVNSAMDALPDSKPVGTWFVIGLASFSTLALTISLTIIALNSDASYARILVQTVVCGVGAVGAGMAMSMVLNHRKAHLETEESDHG